jgi:hypothetical protein
MLVHYAYVVLGDMEAFPPLTCEASSTGVLRAMLQTTARVGYALAGKLDRLFADGWLLDTDFFRSSGVFRLAHPEVRTKNEAIDRLLSLGFDPVGAEDGGLGPNEIMRVFAGFKDDDGTLVAQ